jgi:uncharacterized repeat protein (TIGR03803 family)
MGGFLKTIFADSYQATVGRLLIAAALLLPLFAWSQPDSLTTNTPSSSSLAAKKYTVIHTFTGTPDGTAPAAGLTLGPKGTLFGTAEYGGTFGEGTVFTMNRQGKVKVVYSFCQLANCADGAVPFGSVTLDDSGNIYGTTFTADIYLYGAVFKIDPKGNESVLHTFNGPATGDGANPGGTLLLDVEGNLYGTTEGGGLLCLQASFGCGTVFKIDAGGNETILYSFTGGADGGIPGAGLIHDADWNLYGTSYVGGAGGCGTVYKIARDATETVLYSFNCSNGDGWGPLSGLISDRQGKLYGTTGFGGSFGQGTVFKVTPSGAESVLYSFAGGTTDGCMPFYGSLIWDESGNLYGTTVFCGANNEGTIFRLDPNGKETVLHSFTGGADGANPYGGTLIDVDRNIYGMATDGGASLDGVIYRLSIPH